MKQSTLSKMIVRKANGPKTSANQNYQLTKSDLEIEESLWTRIKTRLEMNNKYVSVFSYKTDYLTIKQQTMISDEPDI